MTDKDLQELLELPETPEEKAALDALVSDPEEEVLERARRRAAEIEKAPPPP